MSKKRDARRGKQTSSEGASRTPTLRPAPGDMTIAFVGTMSSGKSTLINALCGLRLLPTGNQATTGVPTLLRSGTSAAGPTATLFDVSNNRLAGPMAASADELTQWITADARTRNGVGHCVLEQVPLPGLASRGTTIALLDTPGPNGGSSFGHNAITQAELQSRTRHGSLCAIVVVQDCTQLGTTDELAVLHLVSELKGSAGDVPVVVVLNKVDQWDPARDGTVQALLTRHRAHLVNSGLTAQAVLPVASLPEMLARFEMSAVLLTDKERKTVRHLEADGAIRRSAHVCEARGSGVRDLETLLLGIAGPQADVVPRYHDRPTPRGNHER